MPIRRAPPCELTTLLERYPGIGPVLCGGKNGYTLLEQQGTLAQRENRVIGFVSVFPREIPAPLGGGCGRILSTLSRCSRNGTAGREPPARWCRPC